MIVPHPMRIPSIPRTFCSFCLAVVAVAAPLHAAESTAPQFQSTDRVCFIGDSITAGGVYSTYLKIFYATRYPDREIAFFNAGKSGGSAGDAVNRLAWDILVHRPTAATVSFGMNDMSRLHLGISGTPEALEQAIQDRMKSVEANYNTLLDALTKANVTLTLIGPSPYDDTLQVETKIERSNVAMARWTARIAEIAKKRGAGFVDMGAALNPVNQRLQAVDPAASIVGKDRVHPGPAGHLAMAMAILKAQNVAPEVSRIRLDAKTGKPGPLIHCTVDEVRTSAQGVEFLCRENALPFVLPQESGTQAFWGIAEKAAAQIQSAGGPELIPFQRELNRETLHVTGLESGRYQVRIDEQWIGDYGAEELAEGINLAENPKTPQHAQALALAKSLEAVRALESSFFRLVAHVRGSFLEPAKVDIQDEAAVEHCLRDAIAKLPADNYGRAMAERYLKTVPGQMAGKLEELEKLLLQIREQRVLKPHRFSVTRKSEG